MIYLGNNPIGVSTNAIPSDYEGVKDDISTLKIKKLNSPDTNGTSGQILRTNGDGTTVWDNAATEEEISESVSSWLEDNISGGETIAVDSSLTVHGAAADAKKTGIETSALNNAFPFVDGVTIIKPVYDHYLDVSGETVDITDVKTSSTGYRYAVVDCKEGDVFTINGSGGGGAPRLWAFVDSSYNVLSVADPNTVGTNLRLIAPANAAKIIINSNQDGAFYKGNPVRPVVIHGTVDLNDLKTTGTYMLQRGTGVNISHLPAFDGSFVGILRVYEDAGSGITYQEYVRNATGRTYTRIYLNGSWADWYTDEIDSTLTTEGAPADAKATGDRIGEVISNIESIDSIEMIRLTMGYYITTSGSTVDITDLHESSTGYGYAVVDCSENDMFVINGSGGGSPRLWAFIDSSGNVLSVADSNLSGTNVSVIAPADAAKLVINSNSAGAIYKNPFTHSFNITKAMDLNDLKTEGTYNIMTGGIYGGEITHMPEIVGSRTGVLRVIKPTAYVVLQFYTQAVTGKLYTRSYSGGAWHDWHSQTSEKEISILFVGNSMTQDAIAYLPYMLKNYYPEIRFKLYMWYIASLDLDGQYSAFTGGTKATYFSVAENTAEWTNGNRTVTMANVLSTYKFDVVCLQEYFNHKDSYTESDLTAWNNCQDYIRANYTGGNALEFITLFHAPSRYANAQYSDPIERANHVFAVEKAAHALIMQKTICQSIIPAGISVYRALSTELDNLGDLGHLTPDGTHTQEGLPCLLQTYTVLCWLLDRLAISKSVYGSTFRMTTAIYNTINVPGENLGTGVITGTDAENILAQEVAIKAFKEGKKLELDNLYAAN